jgi:hypothetical protein
LSERHGLQVLNPPAAVTVEPPLVADIVGCLGRVVNDGPPDDRLWDKATIAAKTHARAFNDRKWCLSPLTDR